MHHTTFVWVAASVVAVLSVARTARLLIFDDLPPMVWLRSQIVARLYRPESNWAKLWECPFCLCVWLFPPMTAWMWFSDLNTWWWLINATWGGSYLAATYVAYDQPED